MVSFLNFYIATLGFLFLLIKSYIEPSDDVEAGSNRVALGGTSLLAESSNTHPNLQRGEPKDQIPHSACRYSKMLCISDYVV